MPNDFSANVLRERFTIRNKNGTGAPILAMSNRFCLDLYDSDGRLVEAFVIRGQMLHTVVRFAGTLLNTFHRTGPLMNRQVPLDWGHLWSISAGPYEMAHNPDLWISVFENGKAVFRHGDHHAFLDVIEQCDTRVLHNYDKAVRTAEDMFTKAGRAVTINQESSMAATFQVGANQGRCALMMRSAQKTTTFVFHAARKDERAPFLNPVHFVTSAAAFLEGIQLAYIVGVGNEKLRREIILPYTPEGITLSSARSRMAELLASIRSFETLHNVHYRPEQPMFHELVTQAETRLKEQLDREEAEAEEALLQEAATREQERAGQEE